MEKLLFEFKNKSSLFKLLVARIITSHTALQTDVATTYDAVLVLKNTRMDLDVSNLEACNHERVDTRIILHVKNAAENGNENITIRSLDKDVLLLVIHHFPHLKVEHQ